MSRTHNELVDSQFGQRARNYVDSVAHAFGEDLDRIKRIVQADRFGNALDLGCGGGHVTYAMAPHVGRVAACDLSPEMLEAVQQQTQERGIANVDLHEARAESLPFADASFDLVVSRYSVHHWGDWEAGLREAWRVTRPGGKLIFADVMGVEAATLDTHLQTIELLRDRSHVRDRTMSEWMSALGRASIQPTAVHVGRLSMEFDSWVARMETPQVAQNAIRWLQQGASTATKRTFEIRENGDFVVDTIFIEALAKQV